MTPPPFTILPQRRRAAAEPRRWLVWFHDCPQLQVVLTTRQLSNWKRFWEAAINTAVRERLPIPTVRPADWRQHDDWVARATIPWLFDGTRLADGGDLDD